MNNERPDYFFLNPSLTLGSLIADLPGSLAAIEVAGVARFGATRGGGICFCDRAPAADLEEIAAGSIVLCPESLADQIQQRFPSAICVRLNDPRGSFIDLGHKLLDQELVSVSDAIPRPFGIHPTADIGGGTTVHPETRIDREVVVGANCVIHRGTWLQAGAVIRDNSVIGVAGINAYRGVDGRLRNFPHFASAIIGENVEIGANAVVVRGIVNSTRIGADSVIGNLCNVGHGVEIGPKVWMSVGCLIGGHSRIGAGATLGMGVAVKDNLDIGEGAQVGMASAVVKAVAAGTSVFGNPARAMGPIVAGPER
ncbi:MAG TPA: DapH/DapD/GlmU-related protein [Rhodocyclaceae bacterium]